MTATTQKAAGFDKRLMLHVGIVLLFMFGARFIPAPAPITPYGMSVIGIFLGLIYGWTVSPQNMVWSALLSLVALSTTECGTASAVMIKAFGNDVLVLNIVSMLIISALVEAGISEWLVVKLVTAKFAKGKPWLFTTMLIIVPFLLGIFINPMVLAIFLLMLYGKLFKQAGYERGDKYVTMVTLGMIVSVHFAPLLFPFKASMLMFMPVISAASGVTFDFGKYMMTVIPFAVLSVVLYIPLMRLLGCNPSKIINTDLSDLEKKYQYGLNLSQKLILICVILFVLGAAVISFSGGDAGIRLILKKWGIFGWAMLLCAIMMFIRLDGKFLADPNVLGKHISWNILFVIASATTVSGAMTGEGTGVSEFLTGLIGPFVSGFSPVIFVAVVGIVSLLCANLFNNLATIYIMIAVVCALFKQNPNFNMEIAGILIVVAGLMSFLLPAASVYGALLHAQDFMLPSAIYKYGILTILFIILIMCLFYLPLAFFVY